MFRNPLEFLRLLKKMFRNACCIRVLSPKLDPLMFAECAGARVAPIRCSASSFIVQICRVIVLKLMIKDRILRICCRREYWAVVGHQRRDVVFSLIYMYAGQSR